MFSEMNAATQLMEIMFIESILWQRFDMLSSTACQVQPAWGRTGGGVVLMALHIILTNYPLQCGKRFELNSAG